MPTRLLLDGEDLPTLMLRVRAEMGPDARIIKAERIRTGGIAGFFAREHYELTVEVPEKRRAGRGVRRPPHAEVVGSVGPGDATGLAALLAAADAAESQDLGSATPPAGVASAGGGSFERALHAAAAEVDEPDDAWVPETVVVEVHPASQVSTAGDTFAQVLQSMREIVGPPAEVAPVPDPGEAAVLDARRDDATPPAVGGPDGAAPRVDVAEPQVERPRSSVTTLLELGIPTRLLAGFTDPDAPVPLSLLVRAFEAAPRMRLAPGSVVAVVGERNDAMRTATQMAHRSGMDPHQIVLAGDIDAIAGHGRRLQTAGAVARYRARVSSEVPALVVIGVDESRDRWDEPAALLAALDPDHAWAVLDARRKSVDLRRWLRGVGARRPFDAVAAVGTVDAQAPGTVLNLGTPVGWVDGLPASPVVWASVLSERLADDVRWD